MKKIIFGVLMVLLCGAFVSYAAELKVGDKVGEFQLKAALGDNEYTLSSPEFAGRVVYIVYASTSSAVSACGSRRKTSARSVSSKS